MDELSKDTDHSRVRPTRRAEIPGRNPLRVLGRGRTFTVPRRLLRRLKPTLSKIPAGRSTDLTELEGHPSTSVPHLKSVEDIVPGNRGSPRRSFSTQTA